MRKNIQKVSIALLLIPMFLYGFDFTHPSDVVKRMKDAFAKVDSYSASFAIVSKDPKGTKTSKGMAYFKKHGKIHFAFSQPGGDKIISNGKKMWVYIQSLNAVGVQNLDYQKDGKSIYSATSYTGLINIFNRYHYRFDTPRQPVDTEKGRYYILALKEKVASGGFTDMKVYVDAGTYLIHRIEAQSAGGRSLVLELSNINLSTDIPDNHFIFRVEGNIKVVENPLTNF